MNQICNDLKDNEDLTWQNKTAKANSNANSKPNVQNKSFKTENKPTDTSYQTYQNLHVGKLQRQKREANTYTLWWNGLQLFHEPAFDTEW